LKKPAKLSRSSRRTSHRGRESQFWWGFRRSGKNFGKPGKGPVVTRLYCALEATRNFAGSSAARCAEAPMTKRKLLRHGGNAGILRRTIFRTARVIRGLPWGLRWTLKGRACGHKSSDRRFPLCYPPLVRLIRREIPWLCRGGRRCSTDPGVGFLSDGEGRQETPHPSRARWWKRAARATLSPREREIRVLSAIARDSSSLSEGRWWPRDEVG
jgi:hypothetical protein